MFIKTAEALKLLVNQVYFLNDGIRLLRRMSSQTKDTTEKGEIDNLISILTYTTGMITHVYNQFFLDINALDSAIGRITSIQSAIKMVKDKG